MVTQRAVAVLVVVTPNFFLKREGEWKGAAAASASVVVSTVERRGQKGERKEGRKLPTTRERERDADICSFFSCCSLEIVPYYYDYYDDDDDDDALSLFLSCIHTRTKGCFYVALERERER